MTGKKPLTRQHAKRPGRRPHPPRPKTKLTYQIPPTPSLPLASNSPSSQNLLPLRQHSHLLHLLIRRNKNQHRNQPFFKPLSLLHRNLKRLLDVQIELGKLQAPSTASASTSTSKSPAGSASASASESVRLRFEQESHLRTERDSLTSHLREHIVPRCYVAFTGLISDTQFANLAVVLLSLLGGVVHGEHGLGGMQRVEGNGIAPVPAGPSGEFGAGAGAVADADVDIGIPVQRSAPTSYDNDTVDDVYSSSLAVVGISTRVTGQDQGEIIERVFTPVLESEGEPVEDEYFGGFDDEEDGYPPGTTDVDVNVMADRVQVQEKDAGKSIDESSTGTRRGNARKAGSAASREKKLDAQAKTAQEGPEATSGRKKKRKKGKSAIDELFAGLM